MVLFCIPVLRLHAFVTLLLAGLLVSALSTGSLLDRYADFQVNRDKMSQAQADVLNQQTASLRLATTMGFSARTVTMLFAIIYPGVSRSFS